MEKKISAVEWFYDKIKSHFEHDGDLLETLIFTYAIAKEKEKEQRKDAYVLGRKGGTIKDFNQAFKSDNGCACYGSNSMHKCNCK